jgi:phage-related protein
LRRDVEKIEAFERDSHEVKLNVDLDQAGMDRARAQVERLDRQVTEDAKRRGGLLSWMSGIRGVPGGLAGAAGPGLNVPGLLSTRNALIAGGAGIGLGALPALAAPLLGGGVGLAGLGAVALGGRFLIGSRQQPGPLYQQGTQALMAMRKTFEQTASTLTKPLQQAFREIPGLIRSIGPGLRQMFAGAATLIQPVLHGLADLARTVLPLLGQAFRAAAPLMRPLLDGLSGLLRGLLPGVTALLRAAQPAVAAFSHVLAVLGRGVGQMLRDFAPAIRASSIILKALGDVLAAIFPIVGHLAAVMARELGPVFAQLARVVERLLPFLRPLGDVLAKLAGAVLRDLVALLGPVATLLTLIAPSITILARSLGQVFDILESTGVFGAFASALERLAPSLAKIVNDLVRQLAPMLPEIIDGVAKFSDILVTLLAAGLGTILDALDWMINHMPRWLILLGLAAVAWYALDAAMAANPIGATILAIVALVGAITLLVKHWREAWGFIRDVAEAAWRFLTHGWGQLLIPQLFVIRKVIELVRDHWRDAWDAIRGAALAAWHFIHDDVVSPIVNTFTNTLPNAFRSAVRFIGNAWNGIKNVVRAPVAWVVDHVIDGLIAAFDWISGKIGGPHIAPVHPFGLAHGGLIPGFGGGDRHLALLEGGEAVISKETTAAHAAQLRAWGVPGFQQGGPIGRPMPHPVHGQDWLSRGIGAAGHWVAGGLHILAGGGKIMAALATGNSTALMNALMGMFGHGVGGAIGDLAGLLTALPRYLAHAAVHKLISLAKTVFGSPFTGHYGAGVAQWRGDVLRALAMEGLPLNLASRVLYQMQTESGGNPNAINLTDSNAAAGDPSRGLLQTIMSTFRAFHWPGTSWNIYDPLANIAAAINYAVHRYGPSLMSGGMGMGSGHGYDDGGWLGRPLNRTGRPEAVLNPGQSAAFLNLAEAAHRLSRGGGTGALLRDVHLMLPEGTTLAEALREIGWALRTTRQQSFTGVTGG